MTADFIDVVFCQPVVPEAIYPVGSLEGSCEACGCVVTLTLEDQITISDVLTAGVAEPMTLCIACGDDLALFVAGLAVEDGGGIR